MKTLQMTADQLARTKHEADAINKAANHGKPGRKGEMDKDSFLKLLITELRYQDPTRPMEDREFIAQMAQFSTLEQMTNMNKEITTLTQNSRQAEGYSLLGRYVDAMSSVTGRRVSGIVTSIQFRNNQQVLFVGNEEIAISDIHAVRNAPEGGDTRQTVVEERNNAVPGGPAPNAAPPVTRQEIIPETHQQNR